MFVMCDMNVTNEIVYMCCMNRDDIIKA